MIKTKPSDNRATPEWVLDMFRDWFDPCPLNPNPEVDGLELEWKDKTYVNPPYSKPAPWVKKAIEENKKGKTIVLCMRFDPTTQYFRDLIANNAHVFYCGERMKFLTPEGEGYASPFPSILIVLSGSPNLNSTKEDKDGK